MLSNVRSLIQPKPLNSQGKGSNTFRFQNFAERLDAVDIDVHRKLDGLHMSKDTPDERLGVHGSLFTDRIRHWTTLDLSTHFRAFKKEIHGKWTSLPLIIYHKEFILDNLLEHLQIPSSLALPSLLDLLAVLCKDLRSELAPYFERTFAVCVKLIDPRFPKLLELVFTCISYLFKFLHKQIIEDLSSLFKSLFWPLFVHKKPFIRKFAAESVSFLLRKLPLTQLDPIIESIWTCCESLTENGIASVKNLTEGMGQLWFHIFKNVNYKFHSNISVVMSVLLRPTLSEVRTESVRQCLYAAFEHARNENTIVLWNVLVEASEMHMEAFPDLYLGYIKVGVKHRKGSRIVNVSAITDLIKKGLFLGTEMALDLLHTLLTVKRGINLEDDVLSLCYRSVFNSSPFLLSITETLVQNEYHNANAHILRSIEDSLHQSHFNDAIELMEVSQVKPLSEWIERIVPLLNSEADTVARGIIVFHSVFNGHSEILFELLQQSQNDDSQLIVHAAALQVLSRQCHSIPLESHMIHLLPGLEDTEKQHIILETMALCVPQWISHTAHPSSECIDSIVSQVMPFVSARSPRSHRAAATVVNALLRPRMDSLDDFVNTLYEPLELGSERAVNLKLSAMERSLPVIHNNLTKEFIIRMALALFNVKFKLRWESAKSLLLQCHQTFPTVFQTVFLNYLNSLVFTQHDHCKDATDIPTVLIHVLQVSNETSKQFKNSNASFFVNLFLSSSLPDDAMHIMLNILSDVSPRQPSILSKLDVMIRHPLPRISLSALQCLFHHNISLSPLKMYKPALESLTDPKPDDLLQFPMTIVEEHRNSMVYLILALSTPKILHSPSELRIKVLTFLGSFLSITEYEQLFTVLKTPLDTADTEDVFVNRSSGFVHALEDMLRSCRGIVRLSLPMVLDLFADIMDKSPSFSPKRTKNVIQRTLKVLSKLLHAFPDSDWASFSGFDRVLIHLEPRFKSLQYENVQDFGSIWKCLLVFASVPSLTFVYETRDWIVDSICECLGEPSVSFDVFTGCLSILGDLLQNVPVRVTAKSILITEKLIVRYTSGKGITRNEISLFMQLAEHIDWTGSGDIANEDTANAFFAVLVPLLQKKSKITLDILKLMDTISVQMPFNSLSKWSSAFAGLFGRFELHEAVYLSKVFMRILPNMTILPSNTSITSLLHEMTAITHHKADIEPDINKILCAIDVLTGDWSWDTVTYTEDGEKALLHLLCKTLTHSELSLRSSAANAFLKSMSVSPNALKQFEPLLPVLLKGLWNDVGAISRSICDLLCSLSIPGMRLLDDLQSEGVAETIKALSSFKVEERRKGLVRFSRRINMIPLKPLELIVFPLLLGTLLPPSAENMGVHRSQRPFLLEKHLDRRHALLEEVLRALGSLGRYMTQKRWFRAIELVTKAMDDEQLSEGYRKLMIRAICVLLDHIPEGVKINGKLDGFLSNLEQWGASLAVVKVLRHFPEEWDVKVPKIVRKLVSKLRHKDQNVRDEARKVLIDICAFAGTDAVEICLKELDFGLKEEFQRFVYAFTVFDILNGSVEAKHFETLPVSIFPKVLDVFIENIQSLAFLSRSETPFKQMREISMGKAQQSFCFLGKCIDVKSNVMSVLKRFQDLLESALDKKMMDLYGKALALFAQGLVLNVSGTAEDLATLAMVSHQRKSSEKTETDVIVSKKYNLMQVKLVQRRHGIQVEEGQTRHALVEDRFAVFSLDLLHSVLKHRMDQLSDRYDLLDPILLFLVSRRSSALRNKVLSLLLVLKDLPSLFETAPKLLVDILEGKKDVDDLQLLSMVLSLEYVQVSEMQLLFLVSLVEEYLNDSFGYKLLSTLLSRGFIHAKLYDLMDKVLELSISEHSDVLRRKAAKCVLRFVLDYPLKEKRMKQMIKFLRDNLSYERPSGRDSAVELMGLWVSKVPSELFKPLELFVYCFQRLVLETEPEIRGKLVPLVLSLVSLIQVSQVTQLIQAWANHERHVRSALALLLSGLPHPLEFDVDAFVKSNCKSIMNDFDHHPEVRPADALLLLRCLELWKRSQLPYDPVLVQTLSYPHCSIRDICANLVSQSKIPTGACRTVFQVLSQHWKSETSLTDQRLEDMKVMLQNVIAVCPDVIESLCVLARRSEAPVKMVLECLVSVFSAKESPTEFYNSAIDLAYRVLNSPEYSELSEIAQEVLSTLEKVMGSESFRDEYETVRSSVVLSKAEKKREVQRRAVTDPEMAANEKKRRNLMKRENRKRKLKEHIAIRKGHAPEAARSLARRRIE